MKKITFIAIIVLSLSFSSFAANLTDNEEVEKVSMQYIEGFYEGDTEKLSSCLDPKLNKFGFWKNKDSNEYESAGAMTFDEALKYAEGVKKNKNFPKADAPKKVEVIDVTNKIAITKITAWWGVDYMLLANNDGEWMIRQIVWEGPVPTAKPTETDRKGVKTTGLKYIEGFYEGDEKKLRSAFRSTMFKFGYGFDKKKGEYREGGQMTFEKALGYAKWVQENKKFAKPGAPKIVEVLDVMNHIAAVKVTASWGIDYMLLSREGDKWMIDQVLWASTLKKKSN